MQISGSGDSAGGAAEDAGQDGAAQSAEPRANTPRGWYDLAQASIRGGDDQAGAALIAQGLEVFPESAELWNAAGNIFKRQGRAEDAANAFREAVKLAPQSIDYAINHAIAVSDPKLADSEGIAAGLAALAQHQREGERSARYCSVRGNLERMAGDKAEAARWYDAALAIEARRPKALAGRAFIAMDRSEPDALARFDAALAVDQANPDLWLAKARVLDEMGEAEAALGIAKAIAEQGPHWLPGLEYLAELRLAAGDPSFTDHYAKAHSRVPSDPNILFDWSRVLAGNSQYSDAADIAAKGREKFPDEIRFSLLEAIRAGEAGDDERAEKLYAALPSETNERWLHEARHRIRRGEAERANHLLDKALEDDPWSVAGWALRGIAWRLIDDPRAAWLHEQAELVRLMPLQGDEGLLEKVIPTLHQLHDHSAFPLGQSLRGGTQTRNWLFDRLEPELVALRAAILRTVDEYRRTLPPSDAAHPILRLRDKRWTTAGSWSVRLSAGGDHHASHIHPEGIISSALYLQLPDFETEEPKAGWLEIGRPPSDLRLDLEPVREIQPKAGHMALFPSTLYHGTRPFADGQRMTVAFDTRLAESDAP